MLYSCCVFQPTECRPIIFNVIKWLQASFKFFYINENTINADNEPSQYFYTDTGHNTDMRINTTAATRHARIYTHSFREYLHPHTWQRREQQLVSFCTWQTPSTLNRWSVSAARPCLVNSTPSCWGCKVSRCSLNSLISHHTMCKFLLCFCKTCTCAAIDAVYLQHERCQNN